MQMHACTLLCIINKFCNFKVHKEHANWSTQQWNTFHYSDKSNNNTLKGSNEREFVRRPKGKRLAFSY